MVCSWTTYVNSHRTATAKPDSLAGKDLVFYKSIKSQKEP